MSLLLVSRVLSICMYFEGRPGENSEGSGRVDEDGDGEEMKGSMEIGDGNSVGKSSV